MHSRLYRPCPATWLLWPFWIDAARIHRPVIFQSVDRRNRGPNAVVDSHCQVAVAENERDIVKEKRKHVFTLP